MPGRTLFDSMVDMMQTGDGTPSMEPWSLKAAQEVIALRMPSRHSEPSKIKLLPTMKHCLGLLVHKLNHRGLH